MTTEHDTTLAQSRETLAGALRNLTDKTAEIESNERRLSDARKQQQDILVFAEIGEEEQIVSLQKIGSIVQILESKVAGGKDIIDAAKTELRAAADVAMKTFHEDLLWLRDERRSKHLESLQAMVEPQQWPWCEEIALRFIQHTPDLKLLETLGDNAQNLLQRGAVPMAAEQLLADIATLENEKAGKRL